MSTQETIKKKYPLRLGNQTVAQGLLDEGVRFFASYPGTPSTEITEEAERLAKKYNAIVHWASNEAVALEEAVAAAFSGKFAAFSAKHVGLNVAADALMTVAYMGVPGGALVINIADDPSMHSSQNEQDTRWYGRLAHLPVIEPINPQNAYDLARHAVQISHKFELPIINRLTVRISHALAPLHAKPPKEPPQSGFKPNKQRFICLPANSRKNKQILNKHWKELKEWVNTSNLWEHVNNNSNVGIIATSVAAAYSWDLVNNMENPPDLFIPYITHPLPEKPILDFLKTHDTIIIIEELDPILENEIKLLAYHNNINVTIHGKDYVPQDGELNYYLVEKAVFQILNRPIKDQPLQLDYDQGLLAPRPPTFCPGCPHRATYFALKRALKQYDPIITNDIGCYSLGALAPFNEADSMLCMGASISMGTSFSANNENKTVVAVIGDSTFWHTGVSSLANAIWHNKDLLVVVLDNDITAMTGMQPNPSGHLRTPEDEHEYHRIDILPVVKAMGAHAWEVDPFNEKELRKIFKQAFKTPGVKVVVAKRTCAILEGHEKQKLGEENPPPVYVDHEACVLCGICYEDFACPAIGFDITEQKVLIDETLCTGCYYCVDICPKNALLPLKEDTQN